MLPFATSSNEGRRRCGKLTKPSQSIYVQKCTHQCDDSCTASARACGVLAEAIEAIMLAEDSLLCINLIHKHLAQAWPQLCDALDVIEKGRQTVQFVR